MPLSVIVSFVVVFALMLLAVSVGLKFFDSRRKKQVVDMLHTASGEPVVTVGNLLKEIESEKPTGFKRILNSLQFSKHASEQIQQAGLNWSANRLIAATNSSSGAWSCVNCGRRSTRRALSASRWRRSFASVTAND